MGLSASDYFNTLSGLLPKGPAWDIEASPLLVKFLSAWSEEFARIQARADALIEEADPRTTYEMLTDYERIFGLPDSCVTISQTIEQRRAALLSKMVYTGGQSRAYFIGLAEALGYAGATIDEFGVMRCTDDCNDEIYSEYAIFTWRLNLPNSTGGIFVMAVDSDCNNSLRSWGDEAIECRINKHKPAHTTVLFAYI